MRPGLRPASQFEYGQLACFIPCFGFRPRRKICRSQIDPAGSSIHTRHDGIVAKGAASLCRITETNGVDMRDIPHPEGAIQEDVIASGDRLTELRLVFPLVKEEKHGFCRAVQNSGHFAKQIHSCLLYTSDAADERSSVDL